MFLRINDMFHTFQGEGFHAGRRAFFVRLPFCNLKCEWCDTEFNSFKKISEQEFIEFATKEKNRFAVLTGGEPMMNKDAPKIIEILKGLGFEIACETNGVFKILDGIDFATVSPKPQADWQIHPDNYHLASEFKYVVDDEFDFAILDKHKHSTQVRLSLSPEFNQMEKQLKRITEYIENNPQWKLNLQTHKWIGIK